MKAFSSRRAALFLGGVLSLATLLAGCGRKGTRVEEGTRTQVLHLGNLSDPNDLDPAFPDSQQTFNVVMALLEGLCQYDPKTCLPVPGVAERWEPNADATKWTFHLRSDAKWSNGDPVVAGDFVYAYKRMMSPGLAAEYASMLYTILKNGEAYYSGKLTDFNQVGVHAPDAHTLVLDLEHPVSYLDKMVCHHAWYPVHQGTIEKYGRMDQRGSDWTKPGNYVGNGPFVLTEWKHSQHVLVTKSPTYWDRDKVRLNQIYFYATENNTSEEADFRTGQLHVTATIPPDKIPVYRNDPAKKQFLHLDTMLCTYYLRFNVDKPPFNDVRVRRALSLAINRQDIVDRVMLGDQLPAGNLTPPGTGGFTSKTYTTYDPEAARGLLAEAGFPGGAGFPRVEYLYNTSEGHKKIAEALQQMWKRDLGIDITLTNQEAKVWNETMRAGDYQIGRMAWIGDYLEPTTFLEIMRSNDGNNQTNWKNPEYDRLVEQAGRTPDTEARFALYQKAEEILAQDSPIAPIYFYTRGNLRLPEVRGWYGNLLDIHPYKGVYLEK